MHYLHILQWHSSTLQFLMLLLNIAADDALLVKSGMLFHKRLPRNFMESMPNVMLFAAGNCRNCSRSLVLRSYFTSFLVEYSCIKGGLVLLSVLYISIISIQRFWVWTFVSPFFASNSSNVDSWSSSSILSARLCTMSMLSFAAFPQNIQMKGQYLNVDAMND